MLVAVLSIDDRCSLREALGECRCPSKQDESLRWVFMNVQNEPRELHLHGAELICRDIRRSPTIRVHHEHGHHGQVRCRTGTRSRNRPEQPRRGGETSFMLKIGNTAAGDAAI